MSFENAERLARSLGLTPQSVAQRMESFGLASESRSQLAKTWDSVREQEDWFVDHLYEIFMTAPHLKDVLASESRVNKLKDIQKRYLKELLCDPMDHGYVLKRLLIGLVHHKIRITPQWYLASYAHFLCDHVDPILASADGVEARERVITFFQSILFDASLVLDAYGLQEEAQRMETTVPHVARKPDSKVEASGVLEAQSNAHGSETNAPMSHIRLTSEDTQSRFSFIGMTTADLERLRSLQEILAPHGKEVLSGFYQYLLKVPAYQKLVRAEQVDRLIEQVRSYWQELFSGNFDRPYASSRMRIGVIHERIGVTPQLYLAGLARQVSGYLRAIPIDYPDMKEAIKSFFRAIIFDVTFVIDAYMEARGETLLRTEGYAKELMAGLSSSVVIVDEDLRIQFANREFVALVGIDPPILCKMQLADAIHIPELIVQFENSKTDGTGKLNGLFPFGGRFFRVSAVNLDQQSGRSQSFQAVLFEDVSDLLRISNNMEQNETLYANLANSVSAVLWEMDFETKTIEKISRQTLELTGHSHEVFLGKVAAWFNCIAEEDRERFFICCATTKVGERTTCDYRMKRADGEEIWVRSYLSHPESHVSSIRLAAVTVDITQPRRAEKLRLEAIVKLSAGVAHVINNCLTIIVNNVELQSFSNGGISNHPFLQETLKACQQAASVCKKLQAFAGGQMLRPSTVFLANFIEMNVPLLQELVGNAIKITSESIAPKWKTRVDVSQMLVALEHVCANARDAMPIGGSIKITTRDVPRETLSFDDPGFNRDWVEIKVLDTGCGMTDEVRRRAVEPFFGDHNLADRKGLGLSFVYGFVTQSGGHMLLQSQLGIGTSVVIRFPRYKDPTLLSETSNDDVMKPSVLIVDDDESVAQSIAMQFRFMGFRVKTAFGETDAWEVLKQTNIDVLMMDVELGEGCNGIDLAKQISGLYPHLKIIVISGYLHHFQPDAGFPPSWKFLAKPFSAQTLIGMLQALGVPVSIQTRMDA